MPNALTSLVAAELSEAAYMPSIMPVTDWTQIGDPIFGSDTTTELVVYSNNSSKQLVFAFRGSTFENWGSNFQSDLENAGGSDWEAIRTAAGAELKNIKLDSDYSGFQIFSDGHSLGGGMAQTFAIENNISGYGQNSLPISPTAVTNENITSNLVDVWRQQYGNTFNETNLAGDPATLYFNTLGTSFYPAFYISTTTTELSNPYVLGELAGLGLSVVVPFLGVVLTAYSAYKSHSIITVVSQLQSVATGEDQGLTTNLDAQKATVETDSENDAGSLNSNGSIIVTDEDGNKYNISQDFDNDGGVTSYIATYVPGGTGTLTEKYYQANDGSWELTLYKPGTFDDTISDFVSGNTIDLALIGTATKAVLGANNVLSVEGTTVDTLSLQLDPTEDFTGEDFAVSDDGEGGTNVTVQEAQPVSGSVSAAFVNPSPASAVVTGVGTAAFGTGRGIDTGIGTPGASTLAFSGEDFSTAQNTPFKIGSIDYFNGSNTAAASSVELDITADVDGDDTPATLDIPITFVTTTNIPDDPIASADTISFGDTGESFHVEEGDSATVDIYAIIADPPNPTLYVLTLVSLQNPSAGGFVTTLHINGARSNQTVSTGATIAPFTGISIADSFSTLRQTLTVALSAAANGTLTNLGGGSYNKTTGVYTVSGSATVVAAALDKLVFTPTLGQASPGQTVTTRFTITDTDSDGARVNNTAVSVAATVPIVESLSITGTAAGQAVSDQGTLTPFSGVTIADAVLGLTETVSVTLSAAANGTLTNLGGGSYNTTTGVYTISGSVAAIDAALDGLVFTPTAGQATAAGQSVTTGFALMVSNSSGATLSDTSTSVITSAANAPSPPIDMGMGSAPGISTATVITPVFRFFDTHTGAEFLTSSASEDASVLSGRPDLVSEGAGFAAIVPVAGDPNAMAVYRFFDTKLGMHFYTDSGTERDSVLATRSDLTFEGTAFYEDATPQAGTTAVYRFFDTTTGGHFYTGSTDERASILSTRPDMIAEGIAFYAPAGG